MLGNSLDLSQQGAHQLKQTFPYETSSAFKAGKIYCYILPRVYQVFMAAETKFCAALYLSKWGPGPRTHIV